VKGVYHDPEVQRLKDKHPRFFYFLKTRLTPDEEFGLHLTIGVLLTLAFVYYFFRIFQDLVGVDPLIQSDLRFINLLLIFRNPSLNHFMLFVSYLGSGPVIIAGLLATIIFLAALRRWHYVITLLISVIGGEMFVWLISNIVDRPRPALVNALTPQTGYSFPSGHTFVALSFYGLVAYFLFRAVKRWSVKILLIFLAIFVVAAIGLSQIYLGAHWPTDVLGSLAAGAAWLTVLITGLEINRRLQRSYWLVNDVVPVRAHAFGALICLAWFGYLGYFYTYHPLPAHAQEPSQISIPIQSSSITNTFFNMVPRTSETITGKKIEPIGVVIVATDEQLHAVFAKEGWQVSDQIDWTSLKRMVVASVRNQPYSEAPGAPVFWNGRANDYSFAQPTAANSIRQRSHLHIWSTPYVTETGQRVWVGTAHFDKGIRFDPQLFIPLHATDPAVDKEREKIKEDFLQSGLLSSWQEMRMVEPTLGFNGAGEQFFTDGKADVFFVKN
jgi:undecaprenyl-diphosphatase